MPNNKIVLVVTLLGAFLMPFMGSSIIVALPAISKEFDMDAVLLGWIATSFLLSITIFLVPLGRIADIYGRKKVFTYGMIIYTCGSLFAGVSTSSTMLIISRVFQGIGSAMFSATGIAILTSVFPKEKRGRVLGINVAAVYLGLSLGPFIGGFITQHLGWRIIFLVNIPLCLIVILLTFWKIPDEWAESRGEKLDLEGSVIYSMMLISLMYGFSILPANSGFVLILLSIISFFIFIKCEMNKPNPVFNINLFRGNNVFIFSNIAALVNYSSTAGVGFLLSLYLQYIKGFTPQNAGLVLISQPIVMTLFSPFAGKLSDRIEPRIVASIGMSLTVIGLLMLISLSAQTHISFIVVSLIVLGLGFALFSSPNTNAIMSSVDKKIYGIASATLGTMRLLGQMFSIGITMLLFSLYLGRVKITLEYHSLFLTSMKMAFIIFAITCFAGIFASLSRGKIRPS